MWRQAKLKNQFAVPTVLYETETSQNRIVAKLRRQSLELLRSDRRTVQRSNVHLGETKGSEVMDMANHIEDQNWRKFVASVVQQQGSIKNTESIRAVFNSIENVITFIIYIYT